MRNFLRLLAIILLWMLGSWVAPAQPVAVPPINAPMTPHGTPVYFDRYVANLMDFGFVYLDTQALTAGFVDVLGKCAIPQLSPVSNLWTALDCNGVTILGFDAPSNTLVVNSTNRQCWLLRVGSCGGTSFPNKQAFGFVPGSWSYIKTWNTQIFAANAGPDPQGRFWKLSCSVPGPNPTQCVWSISGGGSTPTPAPTGGPTWSPSPAASATPVLRSPTPVPTRTITPGGPCMPVWLPDGRCICQGTTNPCPVASPSPTRTPIPAMTKTPTARCSPCPTCPPALVLTVTAIALPTVPFRTPTASTSGPGKSPGLWLGIGALFLAGLAGARKLWQKAKEKFWTPKN